MRGRVCLGRGPFSFGATSRRRSAARKKRAKTIPRLFYFFLMFGLDMDDKYSILKKYQPQPEIFIMVKFSKANAKIEALAKVPELAKFLEGKRKVYSFDLLSGFSCPFAEKCLSKAVQLNGKRKIKDGPKTEFRCFSASQEVQYTNVFNSRFNNFSALRKMQHSSDDMANAILVAMPANTGIVRIHVAGDFFNQHYFNAWSTVAAQNPDKLFYAYTKSLPFWLAGGLLPPNIILTASRGGRADHLIDDLQLREAVVVYSEAEAEKLGLEIDRDDSHASRPSLRNQNFALLIHGTQPKGSQASEALKIIKRNRKMATV